MVGWFVGKPMLEFFDDPQKFKAWVDDKGFLGRLAFIGMVLAQDTDYIFLDEPLNNLDMKHSVQIMKMLRRITDELGKTVVIVIHDINFASCYSDEIIALQDGEIAVTGTVNEIMQASTLSKLYDMEFNVQEINDKKICVYY